MTVRRQDVLGQPSASAPTHDSDAAKIANMAGVSLSVATAFRAGLVVSREDSARCQDAVERIRFLQKLDSGYHGAGKTPAKPASARSDNTSFLERLDAGYRGAH